MVTVTDGVQAALVAANEQRLRDVAVPWSQTEEFWGRAGDNLRALRLYESEGYKEVARQRSLITAYFLDIREWLYLTKEL